MKLVVVKSNFQVLLVPNWRVFRITVIYVIGGGTANSTVFFGKCAAYTRTNHRPPTPDDNNWVA